MCFFLNTQYKNAAEAVAAGAAAAAAAGLA
jgi:hypothetical protein